MIEEKTMTRGHGKKPQGKHVRVLWNHAWHGYVVDPNHVRFMTAAEKISSEAAGPVLETTSGKWLKCRWMLQKDKVGTEGQVVRILSTGEE